MAPDGASRLGKNLQNSAQISGLFDINSIVNWPMLGSQPKRPPLLMGKPTPPKRTNQPFSLPTPYGRRFDCRPHSETLTSRRYGFRRLLPRKFHANAYPDIQTSPRFQIVEKAPRPRNRLSERACGICRDFTPLPGKASFPGQREWCDSSRQDPLTKHTFRPADKHLSRGKAFEPPGLRLARGKVEKTSSRTCNKRT